MKSISHAFAATALVLSCAFVQAQTAQPTPTPAPAPAVGSIASRSDWPAAKPDDVSSPEAIVAAVYSSISGAKNEPRNTERLRSLFIPDARLIPARASADGAHADAIVLSIDAYIKRSSGSMMANGFFEHSIHNETEQFGNIVQIWSTYESRHNADDPKPFARGINSFQLLKDGNRYWIVNIFWDAETPAKPIPEKYLGK